MPTIDRLADRRRRLAAAGAIAVVSVITAAVMHAAMGGGTHSIVAVALALLASGAIGLIVVGQRLTRRRAAIGVLLDQAVFHTLFAFFGPAIIGGAASRSAHDGHGMPALGLTETIVAASAVAPVAAMIVGHLTAAAVAYAWVRHGMVALESIAAALATAVARVLEPATAAPITLPPRLRIAPTRVARLSPLDALLRLPDRRGPPAFAAV